MKSSRIMCSALAGVAGSFVSAHAALLSVAPGLPTLVYNSSGVTTYNAKTNLFTIDASPLAIRFTPVGQPVRVLPTGSPAMEHVFIRFYVDESGDFSGGLEDADLVVTGQVDRNGDTIPEFAGVLLTGEALAFGFHEEGEATRSFDFQFVITGGAMASEFGGGAIGVTLTSENSTFSGDFNRSFTGFAKGVIGPIALRCGDGLLDKDEQCDDGNTVNTDCCYNTCTLPRCGDGFATTTCPGSNEPCDDGNSNSDTVPNACRSDCTLAACGDGVVDLGEPCDDGNTVDTDCCTKTCTLPRCGDGFVSTCPGSLELCDDGNIDDTDDCRNNCTLPECGDGIVNRTEETCDGGAERTGVECALPCRGANEPGECTCCGDGQVDGIEECDGTNDANCPGQCSYACTCAGGAIGCRITGGRANGSNDPGGSETTQGQGGGQVGAPCGCIGCSDEFDHIQGNWQYSRKKNKGNFHAKEFNSLICGCDLNPPSCGTGVTIAGFTNPENFTQGEVCGDGITGPEPRRAPANIACFSGLGGWTPANGKKEITVAFRVEVEDRGEPSSDRNADDTCDVHRIRIWIPGARETAADLADGACCTNSVPIGQAARSPNIDDGGNLVHGNIQIHPETPHERDGVCPVPNGSCQQP